MRALVIDIGGTSIKVWGPTGERIKKIRTGKEFTPSELVDAVKELVEQESCDVVSVGYPGKIDGGRPTREPWNLGAGWVAFDFEGALGKPVRVMNDAAMQALGAYDGGCMLFIGLGTSVGSALVIDGVVVPLELGSIPYDRQLSLEDMLSNRGLRQGRLRWNRAALAMLPKLRNAFMADYVVLGGGNAKLLAGKLPESVRLGGNHDAHLGGVRLWHSRSLGGALIHQSDPEESHDNDPASPEARS